MSTCNGACCEYHVRCCFCDTKQVDNWSKSLRNVPKVKPVTWAEWLEKGGKKTPVIKVTNSLENPMFMTFTLATKTVARTTQKGS